MEERRKSKRLEIDVAIQLERLDQGGVTTIKYANVKVSDISKEGIGFVAAVPLEKGSFYDTKIQIWTKEVIETVIEIVRVNEKADGTYSYGGIFVGMTEADSLKIDIYRMFSEE